MLKNNFLDSFFHILSHLFHRLVFLVQEEPEHEVNWFWKERECMFVNVSACACSPKSKGTGLGYENVGEHCAKKFFTTEYIHSH